MEKADILEMTVAYLQLTHSRRGRGLDVSPGAAGADVDRYAAGFRECAVHVGQYLVKAGVNFSAVHDRLMSHLDTALRAAVVDVEGFGGGAADVPTEKVSWTDDCDTTGRCSPDTDDDADCRSVSGTAPGVSDVVRLQYAGCGPAATVNDGGPPLNTATSSMATTLHRQTHHPGADADSPRSADEFPSFPPSDNIATTVTDAYTSSVPCEVVEDSVRDASRVTCSLSKSSPVTTIDSITEDSSDVWQPWR